MQFLIFIPAVLLFLYELYRFVKDDYVFIRKGISLEQSFDIAFITLWSCLFASRIFYLFFHPHPGENILYDFLSFKNNGFSLTGVIVGGIVALFLIGKYTKVPLGRLCDFLSLSFLYTLPLVFLGDAIFVSKDALLSVFLNAIIYFVLLLFFVQFLYPKILNRTLKEGVMATLFLLLFSLIALTTSLLVSLKHIMTFVSPENIALSILFILSVALLIKLERPSHSRRVSIR
ncbi:MAG TPA: prolipoprotein diacylglyceryl transferase family protein [Candidatus Saccharimonadales bacterium]|nr:prolipoprotein diacylglyceryl transferase family protein [Candidatus Saccharimonadales bacterium]